LDGSGAFDIEGGISDDQNLTAVHFPAELLRGPCESDRGEAITTGMIAAKRSQFEAFPEAVVPKFDLGTESGIAGQEADSHLVIEL